MGDSPLTTFLKSLTPLLALASFALLIAVLSHGQVVIVPLALAILLTFVLTPLVTALERWGLPRVGSVGLVVVLLLGAVGGFGYVLSHQFGALATRMPEYSESIQKKINTLRGGGKGALAGIQQAVQEVNQGLEDKQNLDAIKRKAADASKKAARAAKDAAEAAKPGKPAESAAPPADVTKKMGDGDKPDTAKWVRVVPAEPTTVERFRTMIEPVFELLATAGIVLVLLIFMLIQREDLRNRLIRLVGKGKVTLTTKTMDEAGERISRFLLYQSIINAGFGVVVTAGLLWIGVDYAALWGFVAALLRFIPYVGSALAMLMPTLLAFLTLPGWRPTLETVGLYLGMDAITANVIEPLLIGHNTGVSSIALLVSAMFWTWLWGPIGLVLSTPITVCLAVLGKHVPQLEFLNVLLGDEQVLETEISFYQRLLAGDEDEAGEIIEQQLQANSREQVFDTVVVPALLLAERDWIRDEITEHDHQFVLKATRDILRNAAEAQARDGTGAAPPAGTAVAGKPQGHILGVPARNVGDELALEMLNQLFDPVTCDVEQLSATTLASEMISAVEKRTPDLVCILTMPPGGVTHARYLCKRLRVRFPDLRILVVRPGIQSDAEKLVRRLTEAGADRVATSLAEARTQVAQLLLPSLVRPVEPDRAGAKKA